MLKTGKNEHGVTQCRPTTGILVWYVCMYRKRLNFQYNNTIMNYKTIQSKVYSAGEFAQR